MVTFRTAEHCVLQAARSAGIAFVGVTTFERALRNRVEDVPLVGRINRIRQYCFDAAPQVAHYLPPPRDDIPAAIAAQAGAPGPHANEPRAR